MMIENFFQTSTHKGCSNSFRSSILRMDLRSIHEFLRKYAANSYTEQEHHAFVDWLHTAPVVQVQQALDSYLPLTETHAGSDFDTYSHLIEKIEDRLSEIDNATKQPSLLTMLITIAAIVLPLLIEGPVVHGVHPMLAIVTLSNYINPVPAK